MKSDTNSRYLIRPVQPGDEGPITELFQKVFGRRPSHQEWLWKHARREAPTDNAWLALENGKPVFHYCGMISRLLLEDKLVPTMIAVDAMTAPHARRNGLLTNVVEKVHGIWRDAGIALVLGLPNEQYGSRTELLGWKPLFGLQCLIRPLRIGTSLLRRLQLVNPKDISWASKLWNLFWMSPSNDAGLTIRRGKASAADMNALWTRCATAAPISLMRDERHLTWRYGESSGLGYSSFTAWRGRKLAGYLAYRYVGSSGEISALIADVSVDPKEFIAQEALLTHALQQFVRDGVESAKAFAIPKTSLHAWLRRLGFIISNPPFQVRAVILSKDVSLKTILDRRKWRLHGGDFDIA